MEVRTNEYWIAHQKWAKTHGSASQHPCWGLCGNQASDWANVHETDRYVPLCVQCHRDYDYGVTCPQGHDVRTFGRAPSGGCRVCHRLYNARRNGLKNVCSTCGLVRCGHERR